MKLSAPFVRILALAALVDWLVTRTLTRSAIFMPKSPAVIWLYESLGLLGRFAGTFAGLLVLAGLIWLSVGGLRQARERACALVLLAATGLSMLFLVTPPQGWLSITFHLALLSAISWLGIKAWKQAEDDPKKLAVLLVALALAIGETYLIIPEATSSLRSPGPPGATGLVFNLGELLVVLSPVALWWAYSRRAPRWIWITAALPMLAFVGMRLTVPPMAGILTIWSTGLTLYLPWPLYAFSLWAAAVTAIDCLRRGEPAGWAVLLLAAGGYVPQFSTQAFLGLIALWLLISGGIAELGAAGLQRSSAALDSLADFKGI